MGQCVLFLARKMAYDAEMAVLAALSKTVHASEVRLFKNVQYSALTRDLFFFKVPMFLKCIC